MKRLPPNKFGNLPDMPFAKDASLVNHGAYSTILSYNISSTLHNALTMAAYQREPFPRNCF